MFGVSHRLAGVTRQNHTQSRVVRALGMAKLSAAPAVDWDAFRVLIVCGEQSRQAEAAVYSVDHYIRSRHFAELCMLKYPPVLGFCDAEVQPIQAAYASWAAKQRTVGPSLVPKEAQNGLVYHGFAPSSPSDKWVTIGMQFAICIGSGTSATSVLSALYPDTSPPPALQLEIEDCVDMEFMDPAEPTPTSNAIEAAFEGDCLVVERHRMLAEVYRSKPWEPSKEVIDSPLHPHHARAPPPRAPISDFRSPPGSDVGNWNDGWRSGESTDWQKSVHDEPVLRRAALSELIIHRAPAPSSTYCRLTVDGQRLTTVVGDGLVVSTASGSTGYAMQHGAAWVDPGIAGVQICPINPYSLAFRPMLLPASSTVMVEFESARISRSLCFLVDGTQHDLNVSDTLRISAAPPLPLLVPPPNRH